MTNFETLYNNKVEQFNELSQQFGIFQSESNELINELELENSDIKKKYETMSRQYNEMKEKRKHNLGSLERELEQCKKQRNQFQSKYIEDQKKIIEFENLIESLESENRASQYMLNQYEQRVQKTMEQLALLQFTLQQTQQDSEEATARLRGQLKQTQQQLYVVKLKHQKHNDEVSTIKQSIIRPNFVRKDTRVSFIPQQSIFGIKADEGMKQKKAFAKIVEQLNRVIVNLERQIKEAKSLQMAVTA